MDKVTDKKRHTDGTKLIWHMDRVIKHYDKGEWVAPIHLDVGLTKKCNVRCVFCYGFFQNMNGAVMSEEAVMNNLVQSARDIGVRSIGFIGDGEPTLNPHLYKAMRKSKDLGISVALSTNGILLDNDEKRDAVLASSDWMRFNISAFTKEGYKNIHGVDQRDKVIRNIENMVLYKAQHGYKTDIGVQMVFVPTDIMTNEVLPLAEFTKAVGESKICQ